MKRRIITILLSALCTGGLQANDGVYYTSGNQLIPVKETDISVKKEILTISLQDDGFAKVDVYYEFYNPGSTNKTIVMGFEADPPYNDDYTFHPDGKHPNILDFSVVMNDIPLSCQNAVCPNGLPEGIKPFDMTKFEVDTNAVTSMHSTEIDTLYVPFSYVYYFNADFKPGINRVHHTYKYKESQSVGVSFEINYKLTPATRWANHQIDDFTLIIRADHTAKHFIIGEDVFRGALWTVIEGTGKQRAGTRYESDYREFSLRNGAFSWHKTNFKPTDEFSITSADCIYSFSGTNKFGSFYDRNSGTGLYMGTGDGTSNQEPASSQMRARIAHNLPYAHRGHVFKNIQLKSYFESLWWYMPDPNYVDNQSDFTKKDKEYLAY